MIRDFIENIYFWFAHRFVKKHRYNTIFLKVKPSYYDPQQRIDIATVQLFMEWYEYEKENSCNEVTENFTETYEFFKKELSKYNLDLRYLSDISSFYENRSFTLTNNYFDESYNEYEKHMMFLYKNRHFLWY